MRHAAVSPCTLALVAIVTSCNYAPLVPLPDPPRETVEFPLRVNRDLDLLFLIDDSPSMADKQANLADNLPHFVDALAAIPGGLPNLHLGVVTSDLGTQGARDTNPAYGQTIPTIGAGGCAMVGKDGTLQPFGAAIAGAYLSDIADPITAVRSRNYTGALSDVFATMVHAGAGGCGFEQHLEAIRHALRPGNQPNTGFLREGANLGVIIVADEDDCSTAHYALFDADTTVLGPRQSFRCTRFGVVCDQGGKTPDEMNTVGSKAACHGSDDATYLTPVGELAAFLRGVKASPPQVAVAAIAGTLAPFATELHTPPGSTTAIPALAHSCSYIGATGNPEVADPPVRIRSFLDQFPARNAFAPICQRDLSDALQQIADLAKDMIGLPCLVGPLADADPKVDGAQYDCKVTVATGQDPDHGRDLPACNASATNAPCWHLAVDAAQCPRGDHLVPVVEGKDTLPAEQYIVARCTLAM